MPIKNQCGAANNVVINFTGVIDIDGRTPYILTGEAGNDSKKSKIFLNS